MRTFDGATVDACSNFKLAISSQAISHYFNSMQFAKNPVQYILFYTQTYTHDKNRNDKLYKQFESTFIYERERERKREAP